MVQRMTLGNQKVALLTARTSFNSSGIPEVGHLKGGLHLPEPESAALLRFSQPAGFLHSMWHLPDFLCSNKGVHTGVAYMGTVISHWTCCFGPLLVRNRHEMA